MDVYDARTRLISLRAERLQALELGVESSSPYMARLEAAIEEARTDYVASAVLAIADLRRSLARPAHG